jgi:hypothetical protein
MKKSKLIIKGYVATAVELPPQIPIKVTAAGCREREALAGELRRFVFP